MPKEYLECGKIVTTHGVRGEVKVQPWCDGPEFLGQFGTLYLDAAGTRPVKVLSAKVAGNMSVLKLEGYPRRGTQLAGSGAVSAACRCQAGPWGLLYPGSHRHAGH